MIRALSLALNKEYDQVIKDLCDLSIKYCYGILDKKTYTKYLEKLGFQKHPQPRKYDNTKYSVSEFAEMSSNGSVYIVDLANHVTVIKNRKIFDIWNCGNKKVGNYWIIK